MLVGEAPDLPVGSVIQLSLFQDMSASDLASPVCPQIAALLSEFDSLFQPSTGLPPQRPCDHSIPLIPGAQPVFV